MYELKYPHTKNTENTPGSYGGTAVRHDLQSMSRGLRDLAMGDLWGIAQQDEHMC